MKRKNKCHACQRTFVADTSIAEEDCFISQSVKWATATRLKENISMTGIACQQFFTLMNLNPFVRFLVP
ncbi:hypothetical protein HCH59_09650 [Enterococcus faecalis]|nr:hypothetical protein [Enterococcus faecalis]